MNFKDLIIDMIRPIYHRISYYWIRPSLRPNRKFKDIYNGKNCVVLCTGSSLKGIDLLKLQKLGLLFGCNLVCKHDDFGQLKFAAYFELDSARGLMNHPIAELSSAQYYPFLQEKLSSLEAPIFFSTENRRYFRTRNLFQNANHHFIKSYSTLNSSSKLSNDLAGKFTFSDGVVFAMIASAIYMGFKEIYLAGCDYTFSPKQSGHFYEDWSSLDPSPIDKRHHRVFDFAMKNGVKIISILPDGFESPLYPWKSIDSLGVSI